jgi:hypothetical protein
MLDDLTMFARYAMMMATGILLREGYIESSMVEPMIGLGVALAAFFWKKYEVSKSTGA